MYALVAAFTSKWSDGCAAAGTLVMSGSGWADCAIPARANIKTSTITKLANRRPREVIASPCSIHLSQDCYATLNRHFLLGLENATILHPSRQLIFQFFLADLERGHRG